MNQEVDRQGCTLPASMTQKMSFESSSGDGLLNTETMRALAHPTRIRILEYLYAHGASTSAQCGEAIGVGQASCSYHLRQLARFRLVERDAGNGRERPWKLPRPTASITWPAGYGGEYVGTAAGLMLAVLRQHAQSVARWMDGEKLHPTGSPARHIFANRVFRLSDVELFSLKRDLTAVIDRYTSMSDHSEARPNVGNAQLIQMVVSTVPVRAPK